jgi:hypothetical protein
MSLLFGLEIKETPTGEVSKNRLKPRDVGFTFAFRERA